MCVCLFFSHSSSFGRKGEVSGIYIPRIFLSSNFYDSLFTVAVSLLLVHMKIDRLALFSVSMYNDTDIIDEVNLPTYWKVICCSVCMKESNIWNYSLVPK
jgi:hypothetical protein